MAFGLAIGVGVVSASFAQDPSVPGDRKPAGIAIEAKKLQTHGATADASRSATLEDKGVFVDAPIGRVWVDPEFVDGEPTYVRRTTAKEGMKIVEISETPFMPVLAGADQLIVNPAELPASW
ncbi:MAG TPA: hypothetical protein VNJ05_04700 [Sphingomicrobium sp.]|nr:hypothetical protein [Sphingomicrobium sp.]